jgi:hypothetical protein
MTEPKTDPNPGDEGRAQSRKPYATPGLVIYGNIAELTRAVDNKGTGDGGKNPMDKS